ADIAGDKIHFLGTGGSDAILLESGGHFALVDAAEDSEYPAGKGDIALPGYEAYVLEYVKRVAGDARGRVTLDFVLGTHAHSDHIGGFDTLVLDPDVTVGRAFLKRYDDARMLDYEQAWDNRVVYGQMVAALAARGVPLAQELPAQPFALGNFQVTILNGGYDARLSGDENDESLGVLLERGGRRAFLAGDINNIGGDENRLAGQIGKVDLLKAGHHGHNGSSTLPFAAKLLPDTVVFTNGGSAGTDPSVLFRLIAVGNARRLVSTGDFGGIVAVFGEGGIEYYAIGDKVEPLPPRAVS
ncbi:MAG: MBL fold metallo-hydrolase, partial [Oscillospiraceae bacterium]|nr:MBL fold metallo-hydrolase [Oscillospiraceae bacterium]